MGRKFTSIRQYFIESVVNQIFALKELQIPQIPCLCTLHSRLIFSAMRRSEVIVPWSGGLHARQAGLLVRTACKYGSSIKLQFQGKAASARSIISLLLLCATVGSTLEIEAQGEDEEVAIEAIKKVFDSKL